MDIHSGQRLTVDFETEMDGIEPEPVHFHFAHDCPVCSSLFAGAAYKSPGGPAECLSLDGGLFSCEDCGSQFRLLSYDPRQDKGEIEVLVVHST